VTARVGHCDSRAESARRRLAESHSEWDSPGPSRRLRGPACHIRVMACSADSDAPLPECRRTSMPVITRTTQAGTVTVPRWNIRVMIMPVIIMMNHDVQAGTGCISAERA
jgi:hypothetical protein